MLLYKQKHHENLEMSSSHLSSISFTILSQRFQRWLARITPSPVIEQEWQARDKINAIFVNHTINYYVPMIISIKKQSICPDVDIPEK